MNFSQVQGEQRGVADAQGREDGVQQIFQRIVEVHVLDTGVVVEELLVNGDLRVEQSPFVGGRTAQGPQHRVTGRFAVFHGLGSQEDLTPPTDLVEAVGTNGLAG